MKDKKLKKVFQHKKLWGNSVLAINLKYWKCNYCGELIKDGRPFAIVKIDGNVYPDIFCSEFCLRTYIIKREAERVD